MSSIIERKTKYNGKWLNFEELTYLDFKGEVRTWENVNRVSSGGAVLIIAKICPSDKLVLIRQFRPPLDNYVIEFPAGLIDSGEEYSTTAIRELKEETGYIGKINKITQPVYTSPGLTNESIVVAFIDIDEKLEANINPEQMVESSEDIEVILVDTSGINCFIEERTKAGDYIDAKLMTYMLARQ